MGRSRHEIALGCQWHRVKEAREIAAQTSMDVIRDRGQDQGLWLLAAEAVAAYDEAMRSLDQLQAAMPRPLKRAKRKG